MIYHLKSNQFQKHLQEINNPHPISFPEYQFAFSHISEHSETEMSLWIMSFLKLYNLGLKERQLETEIIGNESPSISLLSLLTDIRLVLDLVLLYTGGLYSSYQAGGSILTLGTHGCNTGIGWLHCVPFKSRSWSDIELLSDWSQHEQEVSENTDSDERDISPSSWGIHWLLISIILFSLACTGGGSCPPSNSSPGNSGQPGWQTYCRPECCTRTCCQPAPCSAAYPGTWSALPGT